MPVASKRDRSRAINIITEAFQSNPSVLTTIKNDSRKSVRIRALAQYAFDTALPRNGVFVSDNKQAVAICYRYNTHKEGFKDYFHQAKLVLHAIGIFRVAQVLNREAYIKKVRPTNGNFLYFWFFGTADSARGSGAALELKNEIFALAKTEQLPIYLETSVEQNKRVYERYGFEVYHTWEQPNSSPLWFMRKNIGNIN